jgi:hypothetical protein
MKSYKDYEKKVSSVVQTQTDDAEALTRKIVSAYQGQSNASVLKSILEEAEKSKRAGTLSNDDIDNFYKSFAPMLNGFQKKQLKTVVDKLKEI